MINVRLNNPYTTGYVLTRYGRLYRTPVVYSAAPDDKYHIVSDGDELDMLAYRYYGDAKYWWIIYDVNVDLMDNPWQPVTGSALLIPNLQKVIANQL